MPFCDYCDTEQAGVPNGLGALYCFTCGLTISELYFVEEQAVNEAAQATSEKREAQKLARKQKRQQRALDAKNAVPARTATKASVGTLNKKFVEQATMLFCVYCETEQDGMPDGRGRLYCLKCGLTISELYFLGEQALNEAAKAASYNDMAEATDKKREAQKLARKQKRQQRASDAKNAVPAHTAAEASVGTLNKKLKTGSEDDKLIFHILDSLVDGTSQVQQESSGIPIEEVARDCDAHEVSLNSDIELCDQGDSVDPSMRPTIPILQQSSHRKKKGSRSSARSCPKKKDTNFVWS